MEFDAVSCDDDDPGATAEVVVQILPGANGEPQHRFARVKGALHRVERRKRHRARVSGGYIAVAGLSPFQLQQLELLQERAPLAGQQSRSEQAALRIADSSRELPVDWHCDPRRYQCE